MQLLFVNAAALAVAVIYYSWRSYHQVKLYRQCVLRARVTYMLWVMAHRSDCRQETLAFD